MVVLDARTGALKWWHQISPGDWMDLDLVAAPVLYRQGHARLRGHRRQGWPRHRGGSRYASARVPHAGDHRARPFHTNPPPGGARMCPGYAGGVEWNGPALDRLNDQLIVGSVDICFKVTLAPPQTYAPGAVEFGGTVEPDGAPTGWITALDPLTGAVRWKYHADKPVVAGVTPTAGGITFAGDLGGNLLVFDSKSGKLLRKVRSAARWPAALVDLRSGRQAVRGIQCRQHLAQCLRRSGVAERGDHDAGSRRSRRARWMSPRHDAAGKRRWRWGSGCTARSASPAMGRTATRSPTTSWAISPRGAIWPRPSSTSRSPRRRCRRCTRSCWMRRAWPPWRPGCTRTCARA